MPTTRKKVIKTVYKDENDSETEKIAGDFSDSGSDAKISEHSSSEEDEVSDASSVVEFNAKPKKKPTNKPTKPRPIKKTIFAKDLLNQISKQRPAGGDENVDITPALFSVKDLTDADKLLPLVLNLSESDSSDDDSPPVRTKILNSATSVQKDSDNESESNKEYKDVWSNNAPDNSEEIAKKTFQELQQHNAEIEATKVTILEYSSKTNKERVSDVQDLLAQGEEMLPTQSQVKPAVGKGRKTRKARDDSDSEMEDWEEVNEAKPIPAQGLQLIVGIPDLVSRKSNKLDIEMMMKRKMNRVKKEYQVYMHKVHVLCWLGHGNYVSRVLNDQEILAASLSLVPSKECYPGERVDMKYVEKITTWFKDKLTLKPERHEDKFRPKAPPLKEILLGLIKKRVISSKKYLVFIFVSMIRALGLQCRVMFNFVTLPIKPPTSELCSLSTKPKDGIVTNASKQCKETPAENKRDETNKNKGGPYKNKSKLKVSQLDGNDDSLFTGYKNIMQVDGNDDLIVNNRSKRPTRTTKIMENDDVSPPKRARKDPLIATATTSKTMNSNLKVPLKKSTVKEKKQDEINIVDEVITTLEVPQSRRRFKITDEKNEETNKKTEINNKSSLQATTQLKTKTKHSKKDIVDNTSENKQNPPKIFVTNDDKLSDVASKYFEGEKSTSVKKNNSLSRKRSLTANPSSHEVSDKSDSQPVGITKTRSRSSQGTASEKSRYFNGNGEITDETKRTKATKRPTKKQIALQDKERVSHKDLHAKAKTKAKNDVTADLVQIIKGRVREAKEESKKSTVKGKIKEESDEDSDYMPEEQPNRLNSESDDDFKPIKISPKPSISRKIDRRVLSTDDETMTNKTNMWCEIFVEELEQWIAVDVIKGKVHCTNEIYGRCTHPVCYVVGWDNNNYLKDVTRRYVPHWNTVTRKQRAEPAWWDEAVRLWLAPKSARDKEEDEQLNRMQLEAPLPKTIGEYKNHPLYALTRHLLKFEAIFPPDAAALGFVRNEPVYARECVYVLRSRDTWLKEAKVVRLGEKPYKVVKARPKWDKLSNKMITDKPLEVFGPWQVQDYEPPTAENGVVPRNAYGNVELFKECMLPKGTVHIKLPSLNRVAKKLNIDCAPAMTGFDFNGGWSHPVYDGFVVCQEFEEIITEAWVKDQEEQERKELEKMELRVYGNWKRLIKALLIKQRLKKLYGFEDPSTSQDKKTKGPRLVVKKRN